MTAAVEAVGMSKRYGRHWALRDCTLSIPEGRVVGLVGANGAGKTTLLHLAAGLLCPTAGSIRVLDERPGRSGRWLGRIGFVAQAAPLYTGVTVGDHLRFGRRLNPRWDEDAAASRLATLSIDRHRRVRELSGGQRAQVALALAVAKRPELLLLDEPVASLDPRARRDFLRSLMEDVASTGLTVVLSSHLLADLERVCDHLIVLSGGEVRLAGDVDDLLAEHRVLVGPRRDDPHLADGHVVIDRVQAERQTTLLVRGTGPVLDPAWQVSEVGMEELVLAYLGDPEQRTDSRPLALATEGSVR